jgi:DNA-binding PadR family transcriptional regulator
MLELAILGSLKERPMHGYQLSRQLADDLGGLWRVSFGSLYPTLRRLERDGAVKADAQTGAGRRKTVYRITPEGEQLFIRLLEETPNDGQAAEDARFRVRLAFFRYLPPETRIRLLERRRVAVRGRLDALTEALRISESGDDYQRALMEHGRVAAESDIAWLTGLIQAERSKTAATASYRTPQRRATATLRRKEHTA